jgi:hypothetical protein
MGLRGHAAAVAAAIVLATVFGACGGGSTPTTAPTPTPPIVRPPSVVSQGSSLAVQKGYIYGIEFAVSGTGNIDATVDYTYADTMLAVWIAKGSCSAEQFIADQCPFVATSFAGSKPRKVSANGQTTGTFVLIFGNLGSKDEAISYQVVFTPTAAAVGNPSSLAHAGVKATSFRIPAPLGLRP